MRPQLQITGYGLGQLMAIAVVRDTCVEVIIRGLCRCAGIGDAVVRVQNWVDGSTSWTTPMSSDDWKIEGPAL